jgi:transmembrane sensor
MSDAHNSAARIESEAAHWLSRRVEPEWSDEDQAELDRWLGQGYAQKAAFWRLEEGWEKAGRIAALGPPPSARDWSPRNWRSSWKPAALAASVAILMLGGLSFTRTPSTTAQPKGQLIATKVGGHTIVPLDDGSAIELNTATRVQAAVTATSREVWLEKGEAYFDVLHSATVPFVVHAGPKTITVLGTKFSVRRDGDQVTVAVVSGRVRVTDAKAPNSSSAASVAAGSVAVTKPDATLVTESSPQNVEADLAWREGQLVFRNDTLAEAAAEFNRYSDRKLVVSGSAANLKISGSFKSGNVDGFARLLRDAYGLNVELDQREVRVNG